jgi:hypothetical protein
MGNGLNEITYHLKQHSTEFGKEMPYGSIRVFEGKEETKITALIKPPGGPEYSRSLCYGKDGKILSYGWMPKTQFVKSGERPIVIESDSLQVAGDILEEIINLQRQKEYANDDPLKKIRKELENIKEKD